MKKTFLILLVLILILAMVGCATTSSGSGNNPEWLNDLPPEGVLWGIGTAKQSSPSMSMTTAEGRARTAIARQLDTLVQAMLTDYNLDAGNVANQANSSLQENVSRQVTNIKLSDARPIKRWEAKDGTWWYLVEYRKADAKKEVASILNNEEAAFAQFKAQQALQMLDAQLAKNEKPLQVSE
ncbi:MAG: LPP20 family lipoprotein [Spirochaetaceae bacterium]|nr:LPP20 family lipoprotein [Spirochaetaceae bacterium]